MRNIKCSDCAEYRNEWCEKIIDSPHPNLLRDCQYWHERKDMVEVVRCKDCRFLEKDFNGRLHCTLYMDAYSPWAESRYEPKPDDFCSRAEKKDGSKEMRGEKG